GVSVWRGSDFGRGLERQSDRIPLHRPYLKPQQQWRGFFVCGVSVWRGSDFGRGLEHQSDRIPLHRPYLKPQQ
ncbi:hypothetical protein, partial [Vibrio fluvialis]|uniref:hypothetical protein n=1 Tax=Vibrio fluvialis TaxID=676 RepID=UPI001F33F38B